MMVLKNSLNYLKKA